LTRSEVRGGGAKIYRQKGTGRARHSSIVAPIYVGGGVVFAKKPRDFSQKINRNMKAAAFYSALSQKIRQNELTVLDKFALAEAKTKLVAETVDNLGLKGSVIFVVSEYDEVALRASRNIPTVSLAESRQLSVYEIVSHKNIVITADAIKKIEEEAK
ncbi:MAG: 50S ribosomal protein L4, partial [Clostridia bacterium]|nr:50S ribosomal protein L4 [Clostridia bacterium]